MYQHVAAGWSAAVSSNACEEYEYAPSVVSMKEDACSLTFLSVPTSRGHTSISHLDACLDVGNSPHPGPLRDSVFSDLTLSTLLVCISTFPL